MKDVEPVELDPSQIEAYLQRLFGDEAQVLALESLRNGAVMAVPEKQGEARALKAYGYGQPVLVRYRLAGQERQAALRPIAEVDLSRHKCSLRNFLMEGEI